MKKERTCATCAKTLGLRHQRQFCSNKCQADWRYHQYISSWRAGERTGGSGILAKNISRHVRRYLLEKCGNSCVQCGWSKVNPFTNSVILEVDHIDGNSENNKESNLRILCPNCHSLTASFKNLNKGNGRGWRMKKYLKNNLLKS